MQLILTKNDLLSFVLNPASKLTENVVLDFCSEKSLIKTLITSSDNSVICKASVKGQFSKDLRKLIIPDCKSFVRLVTSIPKENLVFEITENSINYSSPEFSFKYYLLDESYITAKKSLSEEKINSLKYQSNFSLTKIKLNEIIKFNSILPEAEKLYFFTHNKENVIYAKLGDEQKINLNELTIEVSSDFQGPSLTEKFPINIQNLLLFSFTEETLKAHLNHELKILKIESDNLCYIVSGLVK